MVNYSFDIVVECAKYNIALQKGQFGWPYLTKLSLGSLGIFA